MRRLVALCLLGLATGSCSLSLDDNDQTNDQDGMDDGLPGDEYRLCVLQTLDQCDFLDLTPVECTDLIGQNCNGIVCDPDNMDPDGQCPPPDDCYTQVFNECIEAGGDPQECAIRADIVCNPQCQPGDPNCCMDPTGESCPPCDPMDPNGQCCDPSTGMDCPPPDDCWTIVFRDCIEAGGSQEECAVRADQVCYPCQDPNDPMCCVPGPDGTCCQPGDPNCCEGGGMCPPPPCDDPSDPNCCQDGMCPPPPCDDPTDPNCCPDGQCPPPPCDDPMDPNCCQPGPDGQCPPRPCEDPMDPNCQM